MKKEKHYIYHITHIENLPNIIREGRLLSKSAVGGQHIDIAHQSVQRSRSNKKVPISPFGCLHDYVPFYFGMRSPMLCAIHNKKVQGYEGGQEQIVYLVSNVEWCQNNQLPFVFTDGHAAIDLSTFYNSIQHLADVDFLAAKAKYWFDDHEHIDRKRKKQSEFLVKETFPWEGILGIVTMNDEMKRRIEATYNALCPKNKPTIVIRPEWYY